MRRLFFNIKRIWVVLGQQIMAVVERYMLFNCIGHDNKLLLFLDHES